MWKSSKKEDGFILMEAMIGLFVLCIALLLILPSVFTNAHKKVALERQADLHRVLYEVSKTWQGEQNSYAWSFNEQTYQVTTDAQGIRVTSSEGETVEMKH